MVPARVVVEMMGADLDLLHAAGGTTTYDDVLAAVVGRVRAASS